MSNTNEFKKVLGLEIHAQISTKTKLFSRALNLEDQAPNSQVDWVDAGMPGALPIVNREAIIKALRTALALNMEINEVSIFDRKHYFYQDLPLGYQITQFYKPIGINGFMNCSFGKVRINRLHIEADAGKSIYDDGNTLVDLNRAGMPLMEIVTEPDFADASQVVEFIKELRAILLVLDTCKCDMESGNLRADVNLSIHKPHEPYGNRVEIKNLNSFRFISKAIEYEAQVQQKTIESGQKVLQETKLFDSKLGVTQARREKEDAVDYRYFADPDLPAVALDAEHIAQVKTDLPKLPQEIRADYAKYEVAQEQGYTLTEHPTRIEFFENIIKNLDTTLIKSASNWICSELLGKLSKLDLNIEDFIQSRSDFVTSFAAIITLCEKGDISRVNAKELLDHLIDNPVNIANLVKEKGYADKLSDDAIIAMIQKSVQESPDEVKKYKNGKTSIIMHFVGIIMKETKGKCSPDFVKNECIKALDAM